MHFLSLLKILRILQALRNVSTDLDKCYLLRSTIQSEVLQRHVPAIVLTLAAGTDMRDMVWIGKWRSPRNGTTPTEYWHLAPYGAEFLQDQNAKPPEKLPSDDDFEEPDEVRERRLKESRKEFRRLRRERRKASRIRRGVQPSLEDYSEVITDENYTSSELHRLPIAQKIAVLRSRCGRNQEKVEDERRIEAFRNPPVTPRGESLIVDPPRRATPREVWVPATDTWRESWYNSREEERQHEEYVKQQERLKGG